jgi:DNA-binding PadR family transcriptional regulator
MLTLKEEMILSALMMHGGSSRGAPIRKTVIELTKKEIVYGTLYNLMEKLIHKDYVRTRKSDPIPVQGGRSKTIYTITPEGKKALRETLQMHEQIRKSLPEMT